MSIDSISVLKILSWTACGYSLCKLLVSGTGRIQVHKEVRDLSIAFYGLYLLGISMLLVQAVADDSTIFMYKQIFVLIPTVIIIGQIFYHKKDHWHNEDDPICTNCFLENELDWAYCPYCGHGPSEVQNEKKKSSN